MATYTLTVKNRDGTNGNIVEYGSNYTAVPTGDSVQTLESGTYLYVATLGVLYIDGVEHSGSWETNLNSDMLIEFDGEDAYITTNASGGSGGSHKTMIGGTVYEIGSGKSMIGGTVHEIAKGKTMINGTVWEIAFSSPITVNISGNGNSDYCYVQINGTKYISATTLEIESGTEITVLSSSSATTGRKNSKVVLNGANVASGGASYTFTPDATAVDITLSYKTTAIGSTVTITTS